MKPNDEQLWAIDTLLGFPDGTTIKDALKEDPGVREALTCLAMDPESEAIVGQSTYKIAHLADSERATDFTLSEARDRARVYFTSRFVEGSESAEDMAEAWANYATMDPSWALDNIELTAEEDGHGAMKMVSDDESDAIFDLNMQIPDSYWLDPNPNVARNWTNVNDAERQRLKQEILPILHERVKTELVENGVEEVARLVANYAVELPHRAVAQIKEVHADSSFEDDDTLIPAGQSAGLQLN